MQASWPAGEVTVLTVSMKYVPAGGDLRPVRALSLRQLFEAGAVEPHAHQVGVPASWPGAR